MFKKIIFISTLFALLYILNAQDITIISMNGTVQTKVAENANWTPAKAGQKLKMGNFIFTGFKSDALVQAGSAKIEVKPLSQISIDSLIQDKNNIVTDIHLKYGKVKSTVDKQEDKTVVFKVRSANSTASVRGTIFSLSNDELYVEEGTVYLVNNVIGNSLLVQKHETAYIPHLDLTRDPYDRRISDYFITANPVGLSESERRTGYLRGGFSGKGIVVSKAQVIITITIID